MQACRYKLSGNVPQFQGSSLSHLVMYSFKTSFFLLPFRFRQVVFLHLFLPLLICQFLSLSLHVRRWSKDAWNQGMVSQAQVERTNTQACRYKPSGNVSQFQGSSLSHLVMYTFKPLFFLPPFSLRWVVLGISCYVLFVLISRIWRPLFTFLHLYFGPCSRDVDIYFPALCAWIVHDVCMYILAHPFQCDCHSPCHLKQSDA